MGVLLVSGCVDGGSGGPAPPVGSTRDRLADTLELALEPGSCRGAVTVERQYGGAMRQPIDLPVIDGGVTLRTRPDGLMEVQDLRVHLDDVVFDEDEFPPDGVHLTGITLTLGDVGEAESEWDEQGAILRARGEVELLLDWVSVPEPGHELPLGTQRVKAVAVEIEVSTTNDGKALVKVHARRHGQFVKATGLFMLSDLGLELRGVG